MTQAESLNNIFGLSEEDVLVLYNYVIAHEISKDKSAWPSMCAKWIVNNLFGVLKKHKIDFSENPIDCDRFSALLYLVKTKLITETMGKIMLEEMISDPRHPFKICEDYRAALDPQYTKQIVDGVLVVNEDKIKQYKAGKTKLFGFFVGKAMECAPGRLHPEDVNRFIEEGLASYG